MRHRPAVNKFEGPGQDSFLDIVANIVGILIILVMVVGVRAHDAAEDAAHQSPAPPPAAIAVDVDTPRRLAALAEEEVQRLARRTEGIQHEIALQQELRGELQLLLTAAQQEIDRRRNDLTGADRELFDLHRELAGTVEEFQEIQAQREALDSSRPRTQVIHHLPTPMAKTVFGKEVHWRLLHGRLSYVPLNELTDRLKEVAPQQIWRLKDSPQFTDTLGPVRDWRMQYTLRRADQVVETQAGVARRGMVELEGFSLYPMTDDLGVPLDEAFRPGSQLMTSLSQLDANATTITVWTYPDSFEEFRRLKAELFQKGFLTAGRPLPDGYPISGSPTGSRSAAE